jgi:hypothetical protein
MESRAKKHERPTWVLLKAYCLIYNLAQISILIFVFIAGSEAYFAILMTPYFYLLCTIIFLVLVIKFDPKFDSVEKVLIGFFASPLTAIIYYFLWIWLS